MAAIPIESASSIARKLKSADMSGYPTSNPGGGKPWLNGGAITTGDQAIVFDAIVETDITAALQAVIDAHDSVSITKPGTYYLSIAGSDPYIVAPACYSLLIDKDNFGLHLGKGVTLKLSDNQQEDADGQYAMFLFQHRSNLTFSGHGTLDSNSQGQSGWTLGYDQNGGFHILGRAKVAGTGCNNITIRDLTMKNTFGNPIQIGQVITSENIEVTGCRFFTWGEGVQFVQCKNVKVTGCTLRDDTGQCNGDGFEFAHCERVICNDNYISTESPVGGSAIDLYGSQDIICANNTVDKFTTGMLNFGFPPGIQRTRNVLIVGNTFRNGGNGFANVDAMTVTLANNVWVNIDQPFWLRLGTLAAVTITSASTTATVTQTAHTYITGDSVIISGANETAYNGTFAITVTDENTYTYTFAGAASPATGTIYSRSAYNVVKIHGDTFSQCGTSDIIGIGYVDIIDCTFDKCGPYQVINITAGQAAAITDLPTVRMIGNRFLRCDATPIMIMALEGGVDFAPYLTLRDNDFTETDAAPVTLFFPNALLTNLTGGGNRGYTLSSESLAFNLANFMASAPLHDYFDGYTIWNNAGVLTQSSAPSYSGMLGVALANWDLQDASTAVVDSRFGYTATGTIGPGPDYQQTGPNATYPYAVGLGANKSFTADNIPTLNVGTGSFSCCCWLKATTAADIQVPFAMGTHASANTWRPFLLYGRLALCYGSSSQFYAPNSSELSDATWHFCVWGRDQINGKSFVSIDGVRVESSEIVNQPWSSTLQFRIGFDGADNIFTGLMAGIIIFDMPLNDAQIALLMAGP